MDINTIIITGVIKEISDIKILKNSQKCCWLKVFTDVSFKNKDGSIGHNQATHRVIVYGKYADVIKERANTEQKISIKGRIKTNEWDHNGISLERTFIVLESFKLYKIKEPEEYQQQDEEDYEPDVEEELKFNDDPDSGYLDDTDDSEDSDTMAVLSEETGWPYQDYTSDDILVESDANIYDSILKEDDEDTINKNV